MASPDYRTDTFDLDFAAVGPQRTGTTWLDRMLRAHPALCLPHRVKETMFFDRRFKKGTDWYAWHFRTCDEAARCGEVAPTYFDHPDAVRRLRAHHPGCKIVVTLRDPAARAFSLYLHHRRKGRVGDSFEEAIRQRPRILEAGRYACHLPRWINAFGRKRVCCVLLDDIKACPAEVIGRVCTFLGVAPTVPPKEESKEIVNAASLPRFPGAARAATTLATTLRGLRLHRFVEWGKALGLKAIFRGTRNDLPALTPAQHRRLATRYAGDIRFVEELLGSDLSAWRVASAG